MKPSYDEGYLKTAAFELSLTALDSISRGRYLGRIEGYLMAKVESGEVSRDEADALLARRSSFHCGERSDSLWSEMCKAKAEPEHGAFGEVMPEAETTATFSMTEFATESKAHEVMRSMQLRHGMVVGLGDKYVIMVDATVEGNPPMVVSKSRKNRHCGYVLRPIPKALWEAL